MAPGHCCRQSSDLQTPYDKLLLVEEGLTWLSSVEADALSPRQTSFYFLTNHDNFMMVQSWHTNARVHPVYFMNLDETLRGCSQANQLGQRVRRLPSPFVIITESDR